MLIRRLARPLLAASFIYGGVNVLRDVPSHAKAASHLLDRAGSAKQALPSQVPTDPETLVRIDGAVKIAGGLLLALGKFPRLASLLLAADLIPTTLSTHNWWEIKNPEERANQQIHFVKNLSVLGGLLISAADTGGRPSVGWMAKKSAHKMRAQGGKHGGPHGKHGGRKAKRHHHK